MVYKPNSSTPDYWFEKADQCFRRSRTDSKARVKLGALSNFFMVKAVKLDIKLRKLANGNYSAFFPGLRSRRRRDGISVKQEPPTKIRGSGGRACVDWFQAVRPVDWFQPVIVRGVVKSL